jgi:hypothetical protein
MVRIFKASQAEALLVVGRPDSIPVKLNGSFTATSHTEFDFIIAAGQRCPLA